MRHDRILFGILSLLLACSNKTQFGGEIASRRAAQAESGSGNASGSDCDDCTDVGTAPEDTEVQVESGGQDSEDQNPDESRTIVESFEFQLNQPTELVDYLFVVDNSVSMNRVQSLTAQGFATLAGQGVFPTNGRLAVMSTVPAAFDDISDVHPAVPAAIAATVTLDPGFTHLVSRQSIATFLAATQQTYVARYPLAGCDTEWFSADQKDGSGNPCISAALQIPLYGVGAEAGLTAFKQLLLRNKGKATFRKGAVVNVVFVSDTHDPGINDTELLAARPNFQELSALVAQDNLIAGFYVHAIAPDTKCSAEEIYEKAYYTAASLAKGLTLDICTATDYGPFIRSMAKEGAKQVDPVFVLRASPEAISSIEVSGVLVSEWLLSENAVKLPTRFFSDAASAKVPVKITYRAK